MKNANVSTGGASPDLIACEVCLKETPRSVAQSYEGPDYVYYFCGAECYEKWHAAAVMAEIGVTVTGCELDFDMAQRLARAVASREGGETMLLAWFDRRRGQASPNVPECQRLPGWLAYAQGHGGNLRVDINGGEYSFIFVSG